MRTKDLKGHIVLLIFLLLCFVGCIAFYEVGVNTVKNDSVNSQINSYIKASEADVYSAIASYQYNFSIHSDEVKEVVVTDEAKGRFNERNFLIAKESEVEQTTNNKYYLYVKNNDSYGKSEISDVLSLLNSDYCSAVLLVSGEEVLGSNPVYINEDRKLETILSGSNNSDSKVLECLNGLTKDKLFYTTITLKTASDVFVDGYLGIVDFNGVKLLTMVSNDVIEINVSSLTKLRVAYFVGIALVLIGFAVVVGLMVKKSTKSGGIDAGVNARTANILLICKANGKIIKYNKSFKVAFKEHQIPIKSLEELKIIESEESLQSLIKSQKAFKLSYEDIDEEGNDNSVFFEFLSLKRSGDYSLVGRVITEEYQNERLLVEVSTKSTVTGDDNSFILERRYREIKKKYKTLKDPYVFVITDLKGFKGVNALLGFKAGNSVLQYYSTLLHNAFEGYEVFHINGDEFVILNPNGDEGKLNLIMEKFIDDLKAPIKLNNNEIMLRPVFGIVSSDMDGESDINFENLMDKLRSASSKAKTQAGKSICKYDTNLENASLKNREMEDDLKQAISKNEFVMFYQPQYEINQERVCGFEALLRWNNPKYASISPQVYIEMAEKNGFIIDIGNFITKDVFKTAKEMEQYDIHISVNVSPAQIVQAGFVADFLEEFEKNGLQPGSIALEVTETFLMENFQTVIEKLTILKNRGISIHLDDFGTGYSSMLYLKELPIDTIKVDKEFIKHIETDRFSKVLTSKIISLAKELGDKVIVEGVETKIQKDIVSKFGADIIQGYYIGKALSKEDAFALLKTGKVSTENKSNGKASEE